MMSDIKKYIESSINTLQAMNDAEHCALLDEIVTLIVKTLCDGKKVMLCGNGGSAADSQHIAAEFVGRYKKDREGYPAIALTTDTSILTAVGNDYSFDTIFARQVEALGSSGDVLIGLSTSGNSKNIICAFEEAEKKNITTVAFTGKGGGALKTIADTLFAVDSVNTPDIQAGHIVALHAVCEVVENKLCSS